MRKINKKILLSVVSIMAVLSLAACGKSPAQHTNQQAAIKQSKPKLTKAIINREASGLQKENFISKASFNNDGQQDIVVTLKPKYLNLFKTAFTDAKKNNGKQVLPSQKPRENQTDKQAIELSKIFSNKISNQISRIQNKNNDEYSSNGYLNVSSFYYKDLPYKANQGITSDMFENQNLED